MLKITVATREHFKTIDNKFFDSKLMNLKYKNQKQSFLLV